MADKSNQPEPNNARSGQKITVPYTGRSFEVIVIDPNGIAHGSPSVGLGFRMMEKYAGIPHATLSQRVVQIGDEIHLKSPSGNTFRVVQMKGSDGNNYNVGLEAVKYVEDLVLRVFVDNLQEAHDISIAQARKKYGLGSADLAA